MNSFPNNLKRLRKMRNLKQEDLAERLNVTRQTVSGWETGRRQPDLDTLKALADALDLDVHELIYGEKPGEYPKFQHKFVVWTAVCGCVALASFFYLYVLHPQISNYHSPLYHPDAAKWMNSVQQMGAFALGVMLPAWMSMYVPLRKSQRLSVIFLAMGIVCSLLPLLLTFSQCQLVGGLPAYLVLRLGMTPFGMFILRKALPFFSGILIFLGLNRD